MKVNCDKCNKEFEMDIKIKKHAKGIEEVYFRCEYCKKKYIAYYTDENIRTQQKKIRNKTTEVVNSKDGEGKIREFDDMKAKLEIDMENLKDKMKGTQ